MSAPTPSEAVRVAVQLAERIRTALRGHETWRVMNAAGWFCMEFASPEYGNPQRACERWLEEQNPEWIKLNGYHVVKSFVYSGAERLALDAADAIDALVGDAADTDTGASALPTACSGPSAPEPKVSALRVPPAGADAPDSIDRAMAFEATLVDQQFLHTETAKGDCFRACIATILRKPIQAVPHFALLDLAPNVFVAMECAMAWLNSKGYEMWMNLDDGEDPLPLCIVSGVSPRGIPHAVVGDTTTGAIVHDPHPSRAGLSHISNRLYLFPVAAQGQHAAQAIVTREGQDPQGLGGEAIERGPAGMRPEEIAQPSPHIEPETRNDD